MALIAVSDGFYAYLSAADDAAAGDSVSGLGWTVGFGLIACAALATRPTPVTGRSDILDDPAGSTVEPRAVSMLPYIPLGAALIVVAVERSDSGGDRVTNAIVILTFVGVLYRQYLTMRDNAALTRSLENRRLELQRQAFADQLTGLPNRALFTDRVVHALEQHRRDLRPLALLFVDLDDFKAVNDTLGHPVGDQLVIRVAERLRGALRSSDTVARFGGDEFAVLVEGDTDAVDVGARLVESLRPAFSIGGGPAVDQRQHRHCRGAGRSSDADAGRIVLPRRHRDVRGQTGRQGAGRALRIDHGAARGGRSALPSAADRSAAGR